MIEPTFSGTGPPNALKICVLTDQEYYPWNPAAYLQEYNWELYYLTLLNSVSTIQELVKRDFDIFMNFCDGLWSDKYPGPDVVQALEYAGVAFTGSDSVFYDPSREVMKRVLRYHGILTPEGVEAFCDEDIERAAVTLKYPLMVKMLNSYSSEGIEKGSRVMTPEDLRLHAHRVIDKYGAALIEEFIDGREYTVLIAENADEPSQPKVYRPIEFVFPPGESFKHFAMKWTDWESMRAEPVDDPQLAERLMEAGRKMFIGLNGVSFGRCDMRVNAAGEIFVLEINSNCGIFYARDEPGSADLILLNDPEGHLGFLERILKAALARQKRLQPNWYVRHTPAHGYGLYARRQIAAGEIILKGEQSAHTLVSWEHMQQNWSDEEQRIFERHAYPLTEELWVVPSRDPGEWKPINHACDPNAWWQGLNVTARRTIAADEQITLDYATFYNERMAEFSCWCGAEACRKTIRGTDYRLPIVERYGSHTSDYVRRKRMER